MRMIASDVRRSQNIATILARLSNGLVNDLSFESNSISRIAAFVRAPCVPSKECWELS